MEILELLASMPYTKTLFGKILASIFIIMILSLSILLLAA